MNFLEIVKVKIEFGPGTFCDNLRLTFGGVGVKRFWFWVILSSRRNNEGFTFFDPPAHADWLEARRDS